MGEWSAYRSTQDGMIRICVSPWLEDVELVEFIQALGRIRDRATEVEECREDGW